MALQHFLQGSANPGLFDSSQLAAQLMERHRHGEFHSSLDVSVLEVKGLRPRKGMLPALPIVPADSFMLYLERQPLSPSCDIFSYVIHLPAQTSLTSRVAHEHRTCSSSLGACKGPGANHTQITAGHGRPASLQWLHTDLMCCVSDISHVAACDLLAGSNMLSIPNCNMQREELHAANISDHSIRTAPRGPCALQQLAALPIRKPHV